MLLYNRKRHIKNKIYSQIRKQIKTHRREFMALVVAKVPQLRARMLCTLCTLIKLNECLATLHS